MILLNKISKKPQIKCYFFARYQDLQAGQIKDFQCEEKDLRTGFCIFHDDAYLIGKEIEIGNMLNKRINKLIDLGQEVYCIGYNIPFISVTDKRIQKSIYLHEVKIRISDFRGSIFEDKSIAYLVNTSFEELSFDNTVFYNLVLFNDARFEINKSRFDFSSKRKVFFYNWGKNYDRSGKWLGYVDFKNSKFYGAANFDLAEFAGIALFDNSEFFDNAIFTNTKFYVDKGKNPIDQASFYKGLKSTGMNVTDKVIPKGE